MVGPDVLGYVHRHRPGHRGGEPLAGAGPAPEQHLVGVTVATAPDELLDERMGDEALVDLDDAVRAVPPEAGAPVGDRGVDGGAEAGRVEGHGRAQRRRRGAVLQPERLGHDRALQLPLGVEADVLPLAGPAAVLHLRARRVHPVG